MPSHAKSQHFNNLRDSVRQRVPDWPGRLVSGWWHAMKNAKVTLTRQMIDAAAPAAAAYRLWDARVPGLCLRVLPSGARSWNVRWGEKRDKALGKYPAVTLDVARARALTVLAEATQGTPAFAKPKKKDPTLREFIDVHYAPMIEVEKRSGKATVKAIRNLFANLFDFRLSELEAKNFDDFRTARLKKGRAASTVHRDLDRIRAALNQAIAWGMLSENPAAKIERPIIGEPRVRFLSFDEERRLRLALEQRDRRRRAARRRRNAWAAVRDYPALHEWTDDEYPSYVTPLTLLALNTGMRRGELFKLRWDSVDFAANWIVVRAATAKNQKVRFVNLNSEARAVLLRWRRTATRPGYVFQGIDGGRLTFIRRFWLALMAEARIVGFRFHDLRHHFASRLRMNGVSLETVSELLGHSSLELTQRYAHISAEHKIAAVESIVADGESAAPKSAEAMKLIEQIGDPAALQVLLQRLTDKLAA